MSGSGPAAVVERARPKLNLRLAVGPPGRDGYHPVSTLLVELDGLWDDITVARASVRRVHCPAVPERANLAWQVLDVLERRVGRPLPVTVTITKRLPAQAGLGGGSADAAAVLRAVDRLYGLGLSVADLERVAAAVGSDIPFFVAGGAAWGSGRGERLTPAVTPPFAAVLVRPPFGLATAAVYARYDRLGQAPPLPAVGPVPEWPALAGWVRNDLWPPALALAPALAAPARALRAAGAGAVLLCGSGSCLAGLVGDRAAAERVAAAYPEAPLAVVTHAGVGPA